MTAIEEALEANRRYAEESHEAGMVRPPRRRLAVVACMDARVHVERLLGLADGDAHVIRNAGGIVTEDVIRSLIISHQIGGTREFMILNNTKCGMTAFTDEELAARLRRETGAVAFAPACFHSFTDVEANVREQVRKVRSHPWIPAEIPVRGFVYDVDTGLLTEVKTEDPRPGSPRTGTRPAPPPHPARPPGP